MPTLFSGLISFPLTPADVADNVDVDALSATIDRLAGAKVDAIGLLGSTGTYAYIDQFQRRRVLAAAL